MKRTKFSFRLAALETDSDKIFEIWLENHRSYVKNGQADVKYLKSEFESMLDSLDGDFNIILALDGNTIAGWQGAFPFENNPLFRHEQAMSSTYVAKEYRGLGLGLKLLKKMLKYLPRTRIKTFLGQTEASNIPMIRIVEQLDFKKVGIIPRSIKKPESPELILYSYNVPQCDSSSRSLFPAAKKTL